MSTSWASCNVRIAVVTASQRLYVDGSGVLELGAEDDRFSHATIELSTSESSVSLSSPSMMNTRSEGKSPRDEHSNIR